MQNPLTNKKTVNYNMVNINKKGENKCKMLYLYQKNYNL